MKQFVSSPSTIRCNVLAAVILALVLAPAAIEAQQTAFVWLPKFVCGYQTGNVPLLNNLNPPISSQTYEDFKPGNYATTINVINTSASSNTVVVYATLTRGVAPVSVFVTANTLPGIFLPPGAPAFSIDCRDIVGALPNAPAGTLFEGYLWVFGVIGDLTLQVDGVYTYESQNAFERHLVYGLDEQGVVSVIGEIQNLTLAGINDPIKADVFDEGAIDIAASGAGGLGLGASIDVERCEPVEVNLSGFSGGLEELMQGLPDR